MTTQCFSLFKGRRARATRLDNCGRVVYGTCSTVTVAGKGFVAVRMTNEIREGTTYEAVGADGDLCVNERGCDQRRWINVEWDFCRVDPDLITMMNPNWMALLDYKGDKIGWAETNTLECDTGIALELWSDVSGVDLCDDPNATGQYGYILVPRIVGGIIGDLTVEDDVVSFTLTGRTKANSKWGLGPYDVMLNGPVGTPTPGPLLVPVGADEPRRIFLTTVPPPADSCGCQPLSSPDGPEFAVAKGTGPLNAKATLTPVTGTFMINWGDGSASESFPTGVGGVSHDYAPGSTGTFHVSAWSTASPSDITVETITLPFP